MNPVKLRETRIGRHITALDNTIRAENLDDMLLGEIASESTDKDPGRWFGRLNFLLLLLLDSLLLGSRLGRFALVALGLLRVHFHLHCLISLRRRWLVRIRFIRRRRFVVRRRRFLLLVAARTRVRRATRIGRLRAIWRSARTRTLYLIDRSHIKNTFLDFDRALSVVSYSELLLRFDFGIIFRWIFPLFSTYSLVSIFKCRIFPIIMLLKSLTMWWWLTCVAL